MNYCSKIKKGIQKGFKTQLKDGHAEESSHWVTGKVSHTDTGNWSHKRVRHAGKESPYVKCQQCRKSVALSCRKRVALCKVSAVQEQCRTML